MVVGDAEGRGVTVGVGEFLGVGVGKNVGVGAGPCEITIDSSPNPGEGVGKTLVLLLPPQLSMIAPKTNNTTGATTSHLSHRDNIKLRAMTDGGAHCQVDAQFANKILRVDLDSRECSRGNLRRLEMFRRVSTWNRQDKKMAGIRRGGGPFNARLFVAAVRVRFGRNPVGWEERTNRKGCQSRLHPPYVETIHFGDYSTSKRFDLLWPIFRLKSSVEDTKKPWNIGD